MPDPPIVVQLPLSELERIIERAAQAGAAAALSTLAPRLDRALATIERSGAHKTVLTTAEAGTYAGVKPGTVLGWIKDGLEATRRGGSAGYAIRKADLDDWLTRPG